MNKRSIPCILALLLSAALPSLAQTTSPAPSIAPPTSPKVPADLEITHDVEIGRGGGKVLHAEVIRPRNQTPTRGIIFVHGGGWAGGSNKAELYL